MVGEIQQMLHVAVCAYVPSVTHSSLQQKQGLPLLNQIISWTTLGRSFTYIHLLYRINAFYGSF